MLLYLGHTLFGDMAAAAVASPPPPPPLPQYGVLQVSGLRTGGDAVAASGILRGGSTVVGYSDGQPKVFIEGVGDFIQFTLLDENGEPIDQSTFESMRMTLRSASGVINGRDSVDVLNVNGGRWVAPGTFRVSLTPSDQVAIGPAEYQARDVTLAGVYGDGQPWTWVFLYTLRNLRTV